MIEGRVDFLLKTLAFLSFKMIQLVSIVNDDIHLAMCRQLNLPTTNRMMRDTHWEGSDALEPQPGLDHPSNPHCETMDT